MQWNTAFSLSPSGGDAPSSLDDRIRDLKTAVYERIIKEHVMDLGSGLPSDDGWHKAGSGVAYHQASAPTLLPDGATSLGTAHKGRLWYNTTNGCLYVWSGSAWVASAPVIGSTYMQFPGKSDPGTLWPNTTWSNISSETLLKGRVPRIEGAATYGSAASFGSSQEDCGQGHRHSYKYKGLSVSAGSGGTIYNTGANDATTDNLIGAPVTDGTNGTPRTGTETRVASVTVRIWQRTA